jgi:hypothetical protein
MQAVARKCAHPPCQCEITSGEKYCSEICKDAGSQETEIACECGHAPCDEMTHG